MSARRATATAGDGGGALYKRAVSEPSHPGKIQSADGTWWELASSKSRWRCSAAGRMARIRQPGSPTGTDNWPAFQAALGYGLASAVLRVYGSSARSDWARQVLVSQTIEIEHNVRISGVGGAWATRAAVGLVWPENTTALNSGRTIRPEPWRHVVGLMLENQDARGGGVRPIPSSLDGHLYDYDGDITKHGEFCYTTIFMRPAAENFWGDGVHVTTASLAVPRSLSSRTAQVRGQRQTGLSRRGRQCRRRRASGRYAQCSWLHDSARLNNTWDQSH